MRRFPEFLEMSDVGGPSELPIERITQQHFARPQPLALRDFLAVQVSDADFRTHDQ
jgi:hypothetical protein